MKFTKIPENTFRELQINAGILVKNFDPETAEIEDLIGATSGGINFTATPTYSDWGDDIDNCPKNTMELKKLESWEVTMTGTIISVTKDLAKMLVAVGDVDSDDETHIIPRNDIELTDFESIWWVGDYSDVNTGENAGFMAIKLFNALSTGGFAIQSSDKAKGQFAFTYTGHYSINAQDVVPYEIYVKSGSSVSDNSVKILNQQGQGVDSITVEAEGTPVALLSTVVPSGSTVTWKIEDSTIANIDGSASVEGSGCAISGVSVGTTKVTASITVDGVKYSDTCTITVTAQGA